MVSLLVSLLLLLTLAGCAAKPAARPVAVHIEDVAYAAGKESVRGCLCLPANQGPWPGLVIIHGDRGLDTWTKEQARRLSRRGFATLAVDLYRGELPGNLLDAHIMDRGVPEEQMLGDLRAAVDYLAGRRDVRSGALGVIGWDMGGGYALDVARHDPRLKAVVTCYGRLTTDPEWLKPLNASVLGIFAGKDQGITPDTIARFRAAIEKAGKRVAGLHVYADADHGFLSSGAAPLADARADAWKKIDAYLAAELQR
jgi:carboxymethylenebutenolidase